MLNVAVWSPLPPARTGVADYAFEQAQALAKHASVTLVGETLENVPTIPGVHFATPEKPPRPDIDLYHIGNSPSHGFVLRQALAKPGVVVLHEANIHELWLSETVESRDGAAYLREMRRTYGSEGLFAAGQISADLGGAPFQARYPLIETLVESSLGVIGLTERVVEAAQKHLGGRLSLRLPHHFFAPPGERDRSKARETFEVPADAFLIVAPGLATKEKKIDVLLRSMRVVINETQGRVHPFLLVAGEMPDATSFENELKRLSLQSRARVTGRLDLGAFTQALVAADVVSLLREGDRGEMSGAAIRAMGLSRVVLVSAGGTLAREFEEGVVVPIVGDVVPRQKDGIEERHLATVFQTLHSNVALRDAIELNAARVISRHHNPSEIAARLAAFLNAAATSRPEAIRQIDAERAPQDSLSTYLLQELRGLRDLGLATETLQRALRPAVRSLA